MTAPTISEPPALPSFPTGAGLPDQPGVFIPKFLAFLTWFTLFRAYLVDLIAYFEGLTGGTSSSGTVGILPLTDGKIPPQIITDDDGNTIWVEIYGD